MAEQVETLEDLLRQQLKAVCVGINPSPSASPPATLSRAAAASGSSTASGAAKVLASNYEGDEADAAFSAGSASPTYQEPDGRGEESADRRVRARQDERHRQARALRPTVVILTFKKTAVTGDESMRKLRDGDAFALRHHARARVCLPRRGDKQLPTHPRYRGVGVGLAPTQP